MRSHFAALQLTSRESTSQELSIYTTNRVESSTSSISLVMKRNVFCTAKQGSQAQVTITAPVSGNKHHPKGHPLTDRLWSYKIACSGSAVLRRHPIALAKDTDCSSKHQRQLNRCMPQAEDRCDWGSVQQCESSRVRRVGKALPLLLNEVTFSPLHSSPSRSFCQLALQKNPSTHQIWKRFWPSTNE